MWLNTHMPKNMFLFSAIIYFMIFIAFKIMLKTSIFKISNVARTTNSVLDMLKAVIKDQRLLLLLSISMIMFVTSTKHIARSITD
jgi:hypothetical protein